jgi:hypothetical protein
MKMTLLEAVDALDEKLTMEEWLKLVDMRMKKYAQIQELLSPVLGDSDDFTGRAIERFEKTGDILFLKFLPPPQRSALQRLLVEHLSLWRVDLELRDEIDGYCRRRRALVRQEARQQ